MIASGVLAVMLLVTDDIIDDQPVDDTGEKVFSLELQQLKLALGMVSFFGGILSAAACWTGMDSQNEDVWRNAPNVCLNAPYEQV